MAKSHIEPSNLKKFMWNWSLKLYLSVIVGISMYLKLSKMSVVAGVTAEDNR